jgi:predicted DNA-binding protein with PD1-like motif
LNNLNSLILPLRLVPGDDLRRSLEEAVRDVALAGAFVVSGIGSLRVAVLRYAGSQQSTRIEADLELLSHAGSVCGDGTHLHAVVADAHGRVLGGHLCPGSLVRTTAELLLAVMPATRPLKRRHDERTGFSELVLGEGANGANHLAPPQSRQL